MNNRYGSNPRMGGHPGAMPGAANNDPYPNRSITPNRVYNRQDDSAAPTPTASSQPVVSPTQSSGPSSTGLIRLSLKKPMGIVFEPMYDPNQPSAQRGVRICDLPRTGAAALSRKLQVGDELLQINDKTVSRLTFDEIMDFIIDADPDSVNLLFRRPRKETLQARQGVQEKLKAAANKDNPSTVKWQDEESGSNPPEQKKAQKEKQKKEKKKERKSKRSKRSVEDDETFQSSVGGDESYRRRGRRGRGRGGQQYEESFLDLLIDTICTNSGNVCRDGFRKDEDYFSDEGSSGSESRDEDTYVTYEESVDVKKNKHKSKKVDRSSFEEEEDKEQNRRDKRKESSERERNPMYEDDEPVEEPVHRHSRDRHSPRHDTKDHWEAVIPPVAEDQPVHVPLGLDPIPQPVLQNPAPEAPEFPVEGNGAPIREVEYDDRIDHGADVSVMESLGGPSLLIEKQRASHIMAHKQASAAVPTEIMAEYGLDYPTEFGKSREETIQADPLRFYTYVVKSLLEQHEPEKVRLLDKLLAKYKGREDHLVQKLAVRYNRPADEATPANGEENDQAAFNDAVQRSKESPVAAAAVNTARERMQEPATIEEEPNEDGFITTWPDKEEKQQDPGDANGDEDHDDDAQSESGSEYSHDSVDGTSPAVIAQVSELLNYVYGKTSVPGQIDRVSTIMRAYEGREAVLLELLETKALIKANKEKENADELPAFLRNSPQVQQHEDADDAKEQAPTPMSSAQVGAAINDDISSMSGGASSPINDKHGDHMGSFNMAPHNMVCFHTMFFYDSFTIDSFTPSSQVLSYRIHRSLLMMTHSFQPSRPCLIPISEPRAKTSQLHRQQIRKRRKDYLEVCLGRRKGKMVV